MEIAPPMANPAFRSMPPHMGQPMMPPFGMRNVPGLINPLGLLSQSDSKRREFQRGIFVSGIEKTLTVDMLYEYFNKVKPIHGIKMPLTKFKENKGFAFIYFGSADDAAYVKKTLDRSIILRDKIRVTRIVVAEHTSKMMLRIKKDVIDNSSQAALEDIHTKYFNSQHLERQVERIINPIFKDTIEVNIVNVPTIKDKEGKKVSLHYARIHFYVTNLKEAHAIAKRSVSDADLVNAPPIIEKERNEFEVILKNICSLLNKDDTFNRFVQSEIYEYIKNKKPMILHIKGIKMDPKENPATVAEELKEFVQNLGIQWMILNSYVAFFQGIGVWGNITFQNAQDCQAAYEALKSTKTKFRDQLIYGSMKNITDLRTVIISTVKDGADQKKMQTFWNNLAKNSKVIYKEEEGKEPVPIGRKYDYFSFNILEKKTAMLNNDGQCEEFYENSEKKPDPSFRQFRQIPRRVVIHFFNDISPSEITELQTDMKGEPGFEELFLEGVARHSIRVNHGLGHFIGLQYVKHIPLARSSKPKFNRNQNQNQRDRNQGPKIRFNNDGQPRRNLAPSAPRMDYSSFVPRAGGVPKFNPGLINAGLNLRPPPLSGSIPPIGTIPPQMGMQNQRIPAQFTPPPMGGTQPFNPPPMGSTQFKPPQRTMQPPQMGSNIPQMGSNIPQMGNIPNFGFMPPQMGMGQLPRQQLPPQSQVPPQQQPKQ